MPSRMWVANEVGSSSGHRTTKSVRVGLACVSACGLGRKQWHSERPAGRRRSIKKQKGTSRGLGLELVGLAAHSTGAARLA